MIYSDLNPATILNHFAAIPKLAAAGKSNVAMPHIMHARTLLFNEQIDILVCLGFGRKGFL
jgi:hypothetical protein